ncbi:hypothetical protein [Sorangium cellulosum]|uniref:STAS/SEC14 domain-containing protein n=1 Tax=Sorangium cellulosum TaxID=56 RepID=A0A150QCI0_SORCE|nr:hypothetical protein [Sorangium cellulosum]KYF65680.1 hypothetical protein BE15_10000 [Sorangium cellulosum]
MRAGARYTQEDWDALMSDMIELIASGPFGLINDTRGSRMPNAVQRRAVAQMYVDHERQVRAHLLASGIVGESSLVNGILTALNWLKPHPHPVRVFSSVNDAERWVLQHFSLDLRRRALAQTALRSAG